MTRRGKLPAFKREETEQPAAIQYGEKPLFAFLSLLFPWVDVKTPSRTDPLFPGPRFIGAKWGKAGMAEGGGFDPYQGRPDRIANLFAAHR